MESQRDFQGRWNVGKPLFGFPGFPWTGISIAVFGVYFPTVRSRETESISKGKTK